LLRGAVEGGDLDVPASYLAATAAPAPSSAAAALAAATTARAPSRLGKLNLDPAAIEFGTVQACDRVIGLFGRRHFDEAEATGSPGVAVGHHARGLNSSDPGEGFTKAITGGGKREATDEQFNGHENLLAAFRSEHGRNSEEARDAA
jgi:hypothetical protein